MASNKENLKKKNLKKEGINNCTVSFAKCCNCDDA